MWLVAEQPAGAWEGQGGSLAAWIAGQWLFVAPREGLRVFSRADGRSLLYKGGWIAPSAVDLPTGGAAVDAEARAAIAALRNGLIQAGILPSE